MSAMSRKEKKQGGERTGEPTVCDDSLETAHLTPDQIKKEVAKIIEELNRGKPPAPAPTQETDIILSYERQHDAETMMTVAGDKLIEIQSSGIYEDAPAGTYVKRDVDVLNFLVKYISGATID